MISAFQEVSLIDYPGHVASVIFTGGCNFRCPFCHNRDLVLSPGEVGLISIDDVMGWVNNCRSLIDGVVITGGEPTLWKRLLELLDLIKRTGLKIKLDTNGSRPAVLRDLLKRRLLDYIAMDIKTSLENYSRVICVDIDKSVFNESIDIIKSSGIEHEFRTTCVPGIVESGDIESIAALLGKGELYTLQAFRPGNCIDPSYNRIEPYSSIDMERFKDASREAGLEIRLI